MRERHLDDVIDEMRALGEALVPHTYPLALDPIAEEEISYIKSREVLVDGYKVCLFYSKSDYSGCFLETCQIFGDQFIFLPFNLVCKIACKILGGHELSLVEFYKGGRKVYCWSVFVDEKGRPISSPFDSESEKRSYQGLQYEYVTTDIINFH